MMNSPAFSVFLGLRNFMTFNRGKRRTMAGAAVGIALSMIPLIVVLEVSTGMIEGITRRFIEIGTGHYQTRFFDEPDKTEIAEALEKTENISGVLCAYPVYTGSALIYSVSYKSGIQVKGLPDDIYERDSGLKEYLEIESGTFDIHENNSIMISSGIAELLDTSPGEEVKLLTAMQTSSGRTVLRPEVFTVTGIFSTGYYELDALSAYINYDKAAMLFRSSGEMHLETKVEDPYADSGTVSAELQRAAGKGSMIYSWYQLNRSMYESLNTTRTLLLFIMIIIVVVASVNVASSMIIMIMDRQQDIAILKSCGAGRGQIRLAFIITGAVTGITGAFAGIAAGLLISLNINRIILFFNRISEAAGFYLDHIPVIIRPYQIAAVFITAVILSSLAAVIPAGKAEKLKPLEVISKH